MPGGTVLPLMGDGTGSWRHNRVGGTRLFPAFVVLYFLTILLVNSVRFRCPSPTLQFPYIHRDFFVWVHSLDCRNDVPDYPGITGDFNPFFLHLL